jgi:hypothetical protein
MIPIALTTEDMLNSLVMYRISRDGRGTILVCFACTHTERVQDFDENLGKRRTLAAHSRLKHVHAEHNHETHVRAIAMVMEWQNAPRWPSRTLQENPEENMPLGYASERISRDHRPRLGLHSWLAR